MAGRRNKGATWGFGCTERGMSLVSIWAAVLQGATTCILDLGSISQDEYEFLNEVRLMEHN